MTENMLRPVTGYRNRYVFCTSRLVSGVRVQFNFSALKGGGRCERPDIENNIRDKGCHLTDWKVIIVNNSQSSI